MRATWVQDLRNAQSARAAGTSHEESRAAYKAARRSSVESDESDESYGASPEQCWESSVRFNTRQPIIPVVVAALVLMSMMLPMYREV